MLRFLSQQCVQLHRSVAPFDLASMIWPSSALEPKARPNPGRQFFFPGGGERLLDHCSFGRLEFDQGRSAEAPSALGRRKNFACRPYQFRFLVRADFDHSPALCRDSPGSRIPGPAPGNRGGPCGWLQRCRENLGPGFEIRRGSSIAHPAYPAATPDRNCGWATRTMTFRKIKGGQAKKLVLNDRTDLDISSNLQAK